jgi:hypothetical protein
MNGRGRWAIASVGTTCSAIAAKVGAIS